MYNASVGAWLAKNIIHFIAYLMKFHWGKLMLLIYHGINEGLL